MSDVRSWDILGVCGIIFAVLEVLRRKGLTTTALHFIFASK